MRLLARYLLKEILVPLAGWLGFLFVLLFVMSFLRGTDVLLGSGVTAGDLVRFTLFLTPHFLQQAIPIAFLLAILLGVGRLAEDGELTALHSVGVSPSQLLVGPLLLGGLLGSLMLVMSFTAEPWGLRAVKAAANEIIKKNLVGDVKPGVFYEDLTNLTLYAETVDREDRHWTNVLLHDDRDQASPLLVLARQGRINPSGSWGALTLALEDGVVHRANRSSAEYTVVAFERGEVGVGVTDAFSRKNRFRSPKEELTPAELWEAADAAADRGEDDRPYRMTFHWRFGQALMPVAFAVMGTPLAMGRRQSGRARGYLLTIVGYVLYYVLARLCVSLGEQGQMAMLLAGQLPNVVFAVLGMVGLRQVAQAGIGR